MCLTLKNFVHVHDSEHMLFDKDGAADAAARHGNGSSGSAAPVGKLKPPARLVSQLLLNCLDSFRLVLGRLPRGGVPTKRLIRLVLGGFPPLLSLSMAATAVVGLSQVRSWQS